MTPNLPQLAPAGRAQAPDANEGESPAITTQKGESFDHLMARIASSSDSKSKNSGSDTQTPPQAQAKPEAENQTQGVDAAILAGGLPDMPSPVMIMLKAPAMTAVTTPKADATGLPSSPATGLAADGGPVMLANGLAVEKNVENKTPGEKNPNPENGNTADRGTVAAAINISNLGMVKNSTGAESGAKPPVSSQIALASPPALKTESQSGQDTTVTAPSETPGQPNLAAKGDSQIGPDISGTSIAKDTLAMKKPDQTIKIAEAAGKFLPGNAVALAAKNDLMEQAGTAAANGRNSVSSDDGTGSLTSATTVSVPVNSGSRTVERMQEMVVQQAMRLGSSTSDSLQVVIKPGEGTQLSLELRQRGDGVEVQAVLQHGDFNLLKQGWGDLQQQLQQRGIQLGSLAGENHPAGNNEQFQQSEKTLDESEPVMAIVGGAVSAGVVANGLAGNGGWQMWA
jgi:hypothetical protein